MNIDRRALAGFAAAGVLTVGALYPALAQDSATTPTEQEGDDGVNRADDREAHGWFMRDREARRDAFVEALAAELELPADQVAGALRAVHERMVAERRAALTERLGERLGEAVAVGELTREQADAILAAVEAGVLPHRALRGPGGPGGHHRGG